MININLKKVKLADKKFFVKWWRDKDLIKLTSGELKHISDQEVGKYFSAMLKSKNDYHFMIKLGEKAIGHISLVKQKNNCHETQIVIGEKNYWNRGFGTKAIKILINRARRKKISKIYLEVRPENHRAIRVYEKCGFEKVKIIKYSKNKYLPITLRMELRNKI